MDFNIISFSNIIYPSFKGPLLIFKALFIGFSLILLICISLLILRTNWLKHLILQDFFEFFTYRPYGVRKLVKQWVKITGRLEAGLESEYKLAVIEADSMFDDILKRMGYGGETLGERLKQISPAVLPNVEELLEAHKIRNNIVHDPDYRLSLDEAKKAIAIYEKTLTDLGAL